MFKKIGRTLGGKAGLKFKVDVQVVQLENIPKSVKKCRVVWARGAKVQMTDWKEVDKNGTASFKQTLTQIATIYKDPKVGYESKEYDFKIQVKGTSSGELLTVGKASLDMTPYMTGETSSTQSAKIPIAFRIGQQTMGFLMMVISSSLVQEGLLADDITETSGMTGVSSIQQVINDQDLAGFDEDESKSSSTAKKLKARSEIKSYGSKKKALDPTPEGEEISPMNSELEDEGEQAAPMRHTEKPNYRKEKVGEIVSQETDVAPSSKVSSKSTTKKTTFALPEGDPQHPDAILSQAEALAEAGSKWTSKLGQRSSSKEDPPKTSTSNAAAQPAQLRGQSILKSNMTSSSKGNQDNTSASSTQNDKRAGQTQALRNQAVSTDDQLIAANERIRDLEEELSDREARIQMLEQAVSQAHGGAEIEELVRHYEQMLATQEIKMQQIKEEAAQKVADANKMVDDSMLLATKQTVDLRRLQEEVDRLHDIQQMNGNGDMEHELMQLQAKIQELERDKAKNSGVKAHYTPANDDEDEGGDFTVTKLRKERMQLQRDLSKIRSDAADLLKAKAELEAVVSELRDKVAALTEELGSTKKLNDSLKAQLEGQDKGSKGSGKGLDDEGLRTQNRKLQDQVATLQKRIQSLEQGQKAVTKDLENERQERQALEERLRHQLEEGDDEFGAAEIVEAWEAKYNRLQDRFRMLQEQKNEELDGLEEQLEEARGQVETLTKQVKELQRTKDSKVNDNGHQRNVPAGPNKAYDELKKENEGLVGLLVGRNMELAQLAEREIILKRELYKIKDVNMKLASKMTKLETAVYTKSSK